MRVPPHPSEPLTGTDVVTTMGQSPPSCLGASVAPAHAQVQHGGRGGGGGVYRASAIPVAPQELQVDVTLYIVDY